MKVPEMRQKEAQVGKIMLKVMAERDALLSLLKEIRAISLDAHVSYKIDKALAKTEQPTRACIDKYGEAEQGEGEHG